MNNSSFELCESLFQSQVQVLLNWDMLPDLAKFRTWDFGLPADLSTEQSYWIQAFPLVESVL